MRLPSSWPNHFPKTSSLISTPLVLVLKHMILKRHNHSVYSRSSECLLMLWYVNHYGKNPWPYNTAAFVILILRQLPDLKKFLLRKGVSSNMILLLSLKSYMAISLFYFTVWGKGRTHGEDDSLVHCSLTTQSKVKHSVYMSPTSSDLLSDLAFRNYPYPNG